MHSTALICSVRSQLSLDSSLNGRLVLSDSDDGWAQLFFATDYFLNSSNFPKTTIDFFNRNRRSSLLHRGLLILSGILGCLMRTHA